MRNSDFPLNVGETYFAPAERASDEEIREQAVRFTKPLPADVLDAINEGLLILNSFRQIVHANSRLLESVGLESAAGVLGLRPGEMMQCEYATLMPGGCGTSEHCTQCGAAKAILAAAKGAESARECRITRREGELIEALDFKVRATPMQLDGESFIIFAFSDISHEKRRRALERIFFHDILNTAGGLKGMIEFCKDQAPRELQREVGEVLQISESLLDEIITQKDLAAAESGELTLEIGPVQGLDILRSVIMHAVGLDAAKEKEICIDPGAKDVEFYCDYTLLRRVLFNLVKNALEASLPGQKVTVSCGEEEDDVYFRVHNAGYMPRDVQLKLFQRSFSTKGDGRGLGTYSIKLLTERYLQGKIRFTSSKEFGTSFVVSYPREPK